MLRYHSLRSKNRFFYLLRRRSFSLVEQNYSYKQFQTVKAFRSFSDSRGIAKLKVKSGFVNSQAPDRTYTSRGHVFRLSRPRTGRYPKTAKKILSLNRRDGFFENIAKDFQSEESAEKRVRKFLDTENTLYGFHSILNLRLKFRSASHNLF